MKSILSLNSIGRFILSIYFSFLKLLLSFRITILSFVVILIAANISLTQLDARESSSIYNEAYRIEKISPILAINLYEKVLDQKDINKKVLKNTVNRLFFLYIKFKRFEEIFILNSKFPPDKTRQKKTDQIIKNISVKLKIDESAFLEMVNLTLRNDETAKKELLSIYNYYPNHYLLRYIFAIKFQTGDLDSLAFLISEIPDINPVLKLAYLIKASRIYTTATSIEKAVKDSASISSLTDEQKSDILYFYGIYLRGKKKYRQSIRYFQMSATYSKKEEGFMPDGIIEAAKTLFITGNKKESCSIITAKVNVQSESDELIHLYCKNKTSLKSVKKSILNLFEKDQDPLYQKILQVINE